MLLAQPATYPKAARNERFSKGFSRPRLFFLSTCQEPYIILSMKSLSVGDFKTQLSDILVKVREGESFGILYGKKKELVAELNPPKKQKKQKKRKLGILDGKMKVVFADDFKMTEEEFINLKV